MSFEEKIGPQASSVPVLIKSHARKPSTLEACGPIVSNYK
jgi:hypothetical protein